MAIIGISGYSGSGKDTIGTIIQYLNCYNVGDVSIEDAVKDYKAHEWWLQYQSGWELKKWAGKLKHIASILTGIPVEKFEDQEFKKTELGPEWTTVAAYNSSAPWVAEGETVEFPMTVRELLQRLGTEAMRNGLHTNTWVNALMADYKHTGRYGYDEKQQPIYDYPNWVVTDTRFPNEAEAIKKAGGIIIRVERPGYSPINAHPSETGLDNWDFDYRVLNASDLLSLQHTIKTILQKENMLHEKVNQPIS